MLQAWLRREKSGSYGCGSKKQGKGSSNGFGVEAVLAFLQIGAFSIGGYAVIGLIQERVSQKSTAG